MKLDKAIRAAVAAGALLPALVVAQGTGGWHDDQGRWTSDGTSARYGNGGIDSGGDWGGSRSYPSTPPRDTSGSDYGYGAYPAMDGYPGAASSYPQPTPTTAGDPYATGYRRFPAYPSSDGDAAAVRTADRNSPSYPQPSPSTDWGGGASNYNYGGGVTTNYDGGYTTGSSEDWGRSSYPVDGYSNQPYSSPAGEGGYSRPAPSGSYSDPGTGYGAPSTSSYGGGWRRGDTAGVSAYMGTNNSAGSYADSWGGAHYGGEGGYYNPPSADSRGNPWAGAASGYSREPVEDFREKRRKENPWAFDRPDPARESERRRWRDVAPRPWAREVEPKREAPPLQEPPYGSPNYGYPYGERSYPGYGTADRHYPGGGWNPWSVWGGGLPGGGNWGSWPYMPWGW